MIRLLFGLLVLLLAGTTYAAPPRLVVVLTVDQMRGDYLQRFSADFEHGLKRIADDGAVFTDAHQDHAKTETAAGHATISTGVLPARHGVVGNEFWDRVLQDSVGAVADPDYRVVGAESGEGSSPGRLLRTGLGDWLKEQSPDSIVASVSFKDRSSILLGGQRPDFAYWSESRTARFVTSDYFSPTLPAWVYLFNAAGWVDRYNGTQWTKSAANAVYDSSPWPELQGRDPAQYSTFPHDLGVAGEAPSRRFYARFRSSPFSDLVTLEFAKELLEYEALGRDDSPDILFLGLSGTDYVGHRYGPYSHEMHDQLLRLDAYLGDFLSYLDQHLESADYVVAISADHGSSPVPERLAELGLDAARVHPDELLEFLMPVLEEFVASGMLTESPALDYKSGPVFIFSGEAPSADRLGALQRAVAARLLKHPSVAATYTYDALLAGDAGDDEWAASIARSFHPQRAPDVTVRLRENHILRESMTGTGHGSPYRYDTHVPMVFLGAGISPGQHPERVRTLDIAPTLARILEIKSPDDLDGVDRHPSIVAPVH